MTDAVPVVPHHYNHFHKLRLLNRKRHKTVIIGPESWRRPGHWLMNLPAPTDFNFKASLMQHGGKLVVDKSKGMRKSKGVHFQEPLSIFNKYQDLSENPDWRVRGKVSSDTPSFLRSAITDNVDLINNFSLSTSNLPRYPWFLE